MGISKMSKGDLICNGRCNGIGEPDPSGSYISLTYTSELSQYRLTISEGCAEELAGDLLMYVMMVSDQPVTTSFNR